MIMIYDNLISVATVEFIGTFLFLSVILTATKPGASKDIAPFAIAAALLAVILFGGAISGGHYNPAVTFMTVLNGSNTVTTGGVYVLAQLLGASAALGFSKVIAK